MSGEDLQRQTSVNIIKRFEDTLAPTKDAVIKMNEDLDAKGITVKKGFLEAAAKQHFYNTSKFTFDILLADPDNIKDNFENYLNHFSENVMMTSSRVTSSTISYPIRPLASTGRHPRSVSRQSTSWARPDALHRDYRLRATDRCCSCSMEWPS